MAPKIPGEEKRMLFSINTGINYYVIKQAI